MNAVSCLRKLDGVFAVYKPQITTVNKMKSIIASKLISDLHGMEQRPQKRMVQYLMPESKRLISSDDECDENSNKLARYNMELFSRQPTYVEDWFDHPLVQGCRYSPQDLGIEFGHLLDSKSSGIQLVGLQGHGKTFLRKLERNRTPRSYHLHGRFGQASLTFDGEGKVVERSTWDHITDEKINRVLYVIQGTFRNNCLKLSGIDISSQHAYEMASKGLLRPTLPSGPTVLDLKLVKLDPPDFIIDVTCINESCFYLRKLVHEIGLELRSSAVCTKVWRYRDAIFFAEDDETLLLKQIGAKNVSEIISVNNDNLRAILRRRQAVFQDLPPRIGTAQKSNAEMEITNNPK